MEENRGDEETCPWSDRTEAEERREDAVEDRVDEDVRVDIRSQSVED